MKSKLLSRPATSCPRAIGSESPVKYESTFATAPPINQESEVAPGQLLATRMTTSGRIARERIAAGREDFRGDFTEGSSAIVK